MELTLDNLDRILYYVDVNLYSLMKERGKKIEVKVDRKSKVDLVFLWRLLTVNQLTGTAKEIYLDSSWFDYLWIKNKLHFAQNVKRKKKKDTDTHIINIQGTAQYMEKEMDFTDQFFERIFDVYY